MSKTPQPMYPDSLLPPPLSTQEFYILLALSRASLHAYAIKGAVANDSLGSVTLASGRLYMLTTKLRDEALIETTGLIPAGKSGKERMHYKISEHGLIRLKEELTRLNHALKIAEYAHLLEDTMPLDLQKLIVRHATIEP